MSQLQVTQGADPLASLRIDRTRPARSGPGWLGLFAAVVVVGLAGAGAAYAWFSYGERMFRPQVRVVVAELREPGAVDSVLSAQGYVKSRRQAAIGAKVPGRILQVHVEEGQRVEKDQVLAELEHADTDASLEAMHASLEQSRAEVAETETMLRQDERDYHLSEQLYRRRGVSGSEYERALSKLKATRSRLDSLRAAVNLADARLREVREQRENMFVRAPFAGTVISKEAEVGETITPGGMGAASGRGSVVTLADLEHLEVETDVKEDYVGRIRPGQGATVAVDAVPDRRYRGRVRTIIPMGDRARGTIKVKVEIVDADERLFPEMAATVQFLSDGREAQSGPVSPQVYVPSEAVVKDGDASFVWRVVGERVDRVPVEAGEPRDGRIRIERGLKGGEQLVATPNASLEPGTPVRVVP